MVSLICCECEMITLTQASRERGRVRMMSRAEMPVSMMAHGPGPAGSAELFEENQNDFYLLFCVF